MSDNSQPPIEIPYSELTEQALRGVAEAFVLREGTDYGSRDYSMAQKVAHVIAQLKRGDATIVFDTETESVGIVTRHELGGVSQHAEDEKF